MIFWHIALLTEDDEPGTSHGVIQQRKKKYTPSGSRSLAVNSEEFLKKGIEHVAADEVFFYR